MKFISKIAMLMILAAIQFPCQAAEEDKELSLIAAEQERSSRDEQLDEIDPALKESITTERTQETNKDKKERKKKLQQARKEKEKLNEQKLKDSEKQKGNQRKEETIEIDPNEPTRVEPPPQPEPLPPPKVEPVPTPEPVINTPPPSTPPPVPPITEVSMPDQKAIYANFAEVVRAVHFVPLYVPRKSGYEITALYAGQGIAEVRYGRRWEPTVSLTVRTHKRAEGEELQDISGVTGVKWRVNTATGTTIYIAKLSETQHVAAWAVGHYTFSAQSENLSFAGFHSLVADELVELSTHYYLDL